MTAENGPDGDDDAGNPLLTRLLNDAGKGDPRAAAELLPLVYAQLRSLATRKMRQEQADHTLQATALVHEAYLRLVGPDASGCGTCPQWDGRWHFFGAAAEAMRRILVENARRRGRLKRGGGARRVDLDDVAAMTVDEPPDALLALDQALSELTLKHPGKAQLVKLRYFAGLTSEQAAEALGISSRTADRDWAFAKAWLVRRIGSVG